MIEVASTLRSLTMPRHVLIAVQSAGSCDWVSAADWRTSRDGTILITVPAWTVVKPLSCSTDWKI